MKGKLPFVVVLAATLLGDFSLFAFSGSATNSPATTNSVANSAGWHTIKKQPPAGLSKIHFYNKLNPVWWLKNQDDPKPPDWYKPDDKHRNFKWSFRNPFHNFNFYVIGVADKKVSRSGRFPDQNSNPHGGWDFEYTRYKFLWFPFMSYHRPKFDFYFGWRERGNFGIKFNINPDRHKPKP
ncbi:MAG TPA: hypothetical protein VKV04_03155 [Verrucomicrobiae bacterium]|nr:hypothetical protein [Verrucomicrobiae bacterium]